MLGLILDVAQNSVTAAVAQGFASGLSVGSLYAVASWGRNDESDQYYTRSVALEDPREMARHFFRSLNATVKGSFSGVVFLAPVLTSVARHAVLAGYGREPLSEMFFNTLMDSGYSYMTMPGTALLSYGMTWFLGRGIGYFASAFLPVFWILVQSAVTAMGIRLFDQLRF